MHSNIQMNFAIMHLNNKILQLSPRIVNFFFTDFKPLKEYQINDERLPNSGFKHNRIYSKLAYIYKIIYKKPTNS